jgi:hypothetical protein
MCISCFSHVCYMSNLSQFSTCSHLKANSHSAYYEFPALYWTPKVITMFITAPTGPYPKALQCSLHPSPHFIVNSHLCLVLPSNFFPLDFPTTLYATSNAYVLYILTTILSSLIWSPPYTMSEKGVK